MNRSTNLLIALSTASAFIASPAMATVLSYDAEIAADHAGPLPYIAASTTSLTFDTNSGSPFDFGAVSGSSTIEFILSGDPVAQGRDGFLAVGANGTWNLRYEQWDDTGQLGFTHLGVADYLFVPAVGGPGVATPVNQTHVTYRWDQPTTKMDVYINGVLAGSNSDATAYEMPAGEGFLGAKDAAGAEGMLGVIDRVTVYNDAIDPAIIARHGAHIPEPSVSVLLSLVAGMLLFRRRR